MTLLEITLTGVPILFAIYAPFLWFAARSEHYRRNVGPITAWTGAALLAFLVIGPFLMIWMFVFIRWLLMS